VSGMTWMLGGNQVGNLGYSYDADGRVTAKTGSFAQTNLPQAVTGNTFNSANEMTGFNGAALSYDLNGNLIGDGTNAYSWDARNHLVGITGGSTAGFVYDAFGRRMSKNINGSITQFEYDGLNPVQELDGANPANVTANLLTGLGIDERFSRTDSSGAMNFLTGALGSTLALADSNGAINTSYTYEPFGNTSIGGSNPNPYQFTGRENDSTGLYFYRARYYSPTYQGFIAQDPIAFAGGDTNLYGYDYDEPTDLSDPSGERPFPKIPVEVPPTGPGGGGWQFLGFSSGGIPPETPGGGAFPEASASTCGRQQPNRCPGGSFSACTAFGLFVVAGTEDFVIEMCLLAGPGTPACLLGTEIAYLPSQVTWIYYCHQACS